MSIIDLITKIKKLISEHKQLIDYGIFGVLTTVLNIAIYQILVLASIDYRISNLIAIIVTKIVSYLVNKRFVFRTKCKNMLELFGEMSRYILARGFTGIIDYFGVVLLVEVFKFDKIYVKYFVQVVVIVLNYILGKKAVFISGKIKT